MLPLILIKVSRSSIWNELNFDSRYTIVNLSCQGWINKKVYKKKIYKYEKTVSIKIKQKDGK